MKPVLKELILKNHFNLPFIKRMLKWHFSYYIRRRAFPVSAGVYITDNCNSRCIMCNLWKKKSAYVYPLEMQKKAIDALSEMGCYYYSISGGEPTLVKDLPERLRYASAKIPYVHLVTNGLLSEEKLVGEIVSTGIKELSISIDGTEKFHNALRGREDGFQKAFNALKLYSGHSGRLQITVNSILTKRNLSELRELRKMLNDFPGVHYKYLPLSVHELFQNDTGIDKLLPGSDASAEEMDTFLDEAAEDGKNVNSKTFLKKAKLFFRGQGDILPEQKECIYSYHAVEFGPDGSVYPCRTGMNFASGISGKTDLQEFYSSAECAVIQKNLKHCKRCNNTMPLCYYEPRLNFPITNLVKYYFSK